MPSSSHPLTSVVPPLRAARTRADADPEGRIDTYAIPAVERAIDGIALRLADAVGHAGYLAARRAFGIDSWGVMEATRVRDGKRGGRGWSVWEEW